MVPPAEGFGMALTINRTNGRDKAGYRTLWTLVCDSDLFHPHRGKRDPDLFEWKQ